MQKIKQNGPKIVNKYAKPQKNYSISKCYTFLERLTRTEKCPKVKQNGKKKGV